MTFSLIARCPDTGRFGMVIASSSPAVAARCVHLRAGVGAVASQNVTDPALGPLVLDALAAGQGAGAAVAGVMAGRAHAEWRQVLAVDRAGGTTIHSGARALGVVGQAEGPGVAAAGNLLANDRVPQAMVDAFAAPGPFGDRLVAALRMGRDAGGEAGPVHSAGLAIVDRLDWRLVDLRCDWAEGACPIEDVARAWGVYAPQADAYVRRATDPSEAPSYGVPGDE